ncbi:DUF2635 domain-containing protein [Avibacterium avium]|uniref:DUF2635 domain-containing protein n=1 Tax=Avibacterium avium TaxID=751 RepID=UPI003BF7C215
MAMFKIKPRKGLIIRDPESFEPLDEQGEIKPKTSYWLNHLKNGDVEILSPKTRKGEK